MGAMASRITSLTTVYSKVYSGAEERKYQSSASLAFVRGLHRGPVNSPYKGPVTRKIFHLMTSSCSPMDVTKTLWFRAIRFRFITHKLWTATECLITSLHYKINTNSGLYECQPQHQQEALRECRFPLCLIWRIWNNVLLKVPECPLFHAGLVMNMSWKSFPAFPVMLLTGIQTNLLARIKNIPIADGVGNYLI